MNQSSLKNAVFQANANGSMRALMLGSGLILVAGIALMGYRWHTITTREKAHYALYETLADFDAAEKNKETDWQKLQDIAAVAYEKEKHSVAAPYLLSLQADALIKLNKKDEALECMNQAVAALASSSPFYYVYRTKRALMALDADSLTAQKGVEELQELANAADNKNSDQARYYLGHYYWSRNEIPLAQQVWSPLLPLINESETSSIWAVRAQEKMKMIA